MKTLEKFPMLLCFALTIGVVWLAWANRVNLRLGMSFTNAPDTESHEQEKKANDPCWYITPEGFHGATSEMKNKRLERNNIQIFGYVTDTPLSEALAIFNEEMKCSPLFREYPPLTEDEVIAAIVVGVNDNKRGSIFHAEKEAFWKIATHKIMPKGSIIRVHNGGNVQSSPLHPDKTINAKGVEIFLLLGADKNGRSEFPPPPKLEEQLIIRKTFSGIVVK